MKDYSKKVKNELKDWFLSSFKHLGFRSLWQVVDYHLKRESKERKILLSEIDGF